MYAIRSYYDEIDVVFPIPEDILEECFHNFCNYGSQVSAGKTRIYHYFKDVDNLKERVNFLKDEYGTGGCSWNYAPYKYTGFIDWDAKGISLKFSEGVITSYSIHYTKLYE